MVLEQREQVRGRESDWELRRSERLREGAPNGGMLD